MSKINFVAKSGDKKTGKIPVTWSERSTCPDTCAWYKKGCYGLGGNCRMHWEKVATNGQELTEVCVKIGNLADGQLWRMNVVGDLPGKNHNIDKRKLQAIAKANKGKAGFTYTHKPVIGSKQAKENQKAIKQANKDGFTINLSADNLKHADQLVGLGIGPVCVVLPKDSPKKIETPKGNKVVKCPATISDNVTCATCKLCAKVDRTYIIGFEAHGCASKTVSEKAKG